MAKVKLRLYADVVKDPKSGKIRLAFKNPDYYQQQVRQLKYDKRVIVTIENERAQRSPNQNNYWWGVCYPIIAEATGYTDNEVYEWAKQTFLPPKIIKIGDKEVTVVKGTSELSVGEGVEFTMAMRQFAVDKLNAYISTPCEAGYSCGRRDCSTCYPPEIEKQGVVK